MTPDDWLRAKAVALEAWERPDAERMSYIAVACGDDEQLRREVSSLVVSMIAATDRYEVPAACLPDDGRGAPARLVGQQLGPYEVLSPIGAGGMGEVYTARDTRLGRIVAVKALPAGASGDPASSERMAREARVVAALKHPHICTLFDIGRHEGLDYFVMEYVEGETLATRLSRGQLPIDEALQYAQEIASALAEAHHAGIVHRDVKPANVMLHRTGSRASDGAAHVKLLDFGVARASAKDTPSASRQTAPLDLTGAGFAVGTVHYMSPEQIEGTATDARADIFAFGAVLFEMLTGKRAFDGADRAAVIDAVLTREIPLLSTVRRGCPAALDPIVRRCLAKSATDRYETADELLADLRSVRRRLESRRGARALLAAAAAVVVLTIGVAALWAVRGRPGAGSAPAPVVVRLASTAGVLGAPALSPDGSTLVFSWAGDDLDSPDLVLLPVGSTETRRLTDDPGLEQWPAWSPDGTQVAFVRCGGGRCGIFVLPVTGGPERKLRDLREDRYYWLAWSPDGKTIAYAERPSPAEPYALFLLSTDTLVSRRLTTPPGGNLGDLRFAFSPDGGRLAVIRLDGIAGIGVHVLSVGTGADTTVLSGQHEWFGGITWSAGGRSLILSADQRGVRHLWTVPVSGGTLQQLAVAGENAYFPAVSARGNRLAFVREFRDWDFSQVALRHGKAGESTAFASSPRLDLNPAYSPDGRKLAFVSERSGTREVWVSNADGSGASQLTSLGGPAAGWPSWSPDGRYLAFQARGISVIPAVGGPMRVVSAAGDRSTGSERPTWSADGKWMYFFSPDSAGRFSIWKVSIDGGAVVQVSTSEASSAREDPRGTDLYFTKLNSGIVRRPVAGGEETLVVPDFSFSLPGYWSVVADGIYYVAQEWQPDNTSLNRLRFFDFASRRTVDLGMLPGILDDWVGGLTVSPDRRTILYSHRSYASSEIVLIEHFR
jgi:Tol biopolymer transport system component